ncbi:hypothetical protein, partial [Phenylobacterium sp.]
MSVTKTLLPSASALVFALMAAPMAMAQSQGVEVDELVVTGSQVELAPVYAGGQVARGGRVG